jgi:phosphatidylglycerol lysyltransferase
MSIAPDKVDAGAPRRSSRLAKKLLAQAGALVSLVIICLALWVVHHMLHGIRLSDLMENIRALSFSSIALAFLAMAAAYLVTTTYDVLALRHIDRPLPYPRVALASFLASVFGMNLGFAVVTGAAIRYRIYSRAGLSALEIAGVTALSALTATLGVGFIFILSMLFGTGAASESILHLSAPWRLALGGLLLAILVGYIAVTAIRPVTIRTQSWSLALPSARITSAQIALGSIDLMLIGTLIYLLLPAHVESNFLAFLGVFALALMAGILSHVPGGIGVFESVMLFGLPDVPPAGLLSAILLFRCIYYLAPLGLAATLLAIHEAHLHRARIATARDTTMDWLAEIGPQVMTLIVIFAGMLLLFSGAIPAPAARLGGLGEILPLPLLELFHVIAGVAGLGLVIVARALSLRLNAAYRWAMSLLGAGIAALLFKGLIYEGAILLGMVLVLLLYTRPEFQRKGSIFDQGFPAEWVSILTAILAVTVWLGLFSYKPFHYSQDLWWHFHYEGEFPRFLRTTLTIFILTGGLTLYSLLRTDPIPDRPHTTSLNQIRKIVRKDTNTRANLALLGDKRFLFSDSGKAFIMYRVKGKSWIALGDPVGPRQEHEKLVWTFRELCDRYGGWPVFYQADGENLPLYVDLGLSLLRLGDDARVPLTGFSLQGPERAELRGIHDRVLKQGVDFSIVNSQDVPPLLPELQTVSDDWLAQAKVSEKGFSRGIFNADYLRNFPCAVVRKDQRIVAFAILWVSAHKEELALDLMRYHRDAPEGTMRFLVTELMLGAQRRGYRWFNLGMVPSAALERHALAPLWQRVGGMMYRQSEHFRDSESLRRFAAELGPIWRPKYLASPGGLRTPRILRDIASLIFQSRV